MKRLLVNANSDGGDTRYEWTICEYYLQFMHVHDFAFVGSVSKTPLLSTPNASHAVLLQGVRSSVEKVATAFHQPVCNPRESNH
jgi:hypothetical protein